MNEIAKILITRLEDGSTRVQAQVGSIAGCTAEDLAVGMLEAAKKLLQHPPTNGSPIAVAQQMPVIGGKRF